MDWGSEEVRLRIAREVAQYHIGDAAWADMIVGAYKDPERYHRELVEEWGGDDRPLD